MRLWWTNTCSGMSALASKSFLTQSMPDTGTVHLPLLRNHGHVLQELQGWTIPALEPAGFGRKPKWHKVLSIQVDQKGPTHHAGRFGARSVLQNLILREWVCPSSRKQGFLICSWPRGDLSTEGLGQLLGQSRI